MTDRELKKLSRADLLELLLKETQENEKLRAQLEEANKKLEDRDILIQNTGSLAEAAMKMNGVFEAADRAVRQYLENVRRIGSEQGQ